MKIKNVNSSHCRKCLQLSLPVDMMIRFARLANPDYNIYKRTGLSEGMPIPNQIAAQRIVADMIQDGFYVDFVEKLITIGNEGYMGRHYQLHGLDNVIEGVMHEGYTFDKVTGQFFENQRERISVNWGRLQEGDERKITVLRLDIAGNSILVKNNTRQKVESAYNDMRAIVNKTVVNRLGRLWSWEGDGAVAAFLFGPMEKMAVGAGMEILHELFFYNRIRNPLDSPINVRMGVHTGQVLYSDNELKRNKNDTIKKAVTLEDLAPANNLCVSYNVYINMDTNILSLFGPEKSHKGGKYRLYSMGPEK